MNIPLRSLSIAVVVSGVLLAGSPDALSQLQDEVARQRGEIDELKMLLAQQKNLLDQVLSARTDGQARPGVAAPAAPAPAPQPSVTVADLAKQTDSLSRSLGGFQFSGDFRYRLDLQ